MDITSIGSSSEPAFSTETTLDSIGLGQDAFLTMLIAQLKYQDPLDPVKNEERTPASSQPFVRPKPSDTSDPRYYVTTFG